jgi:hypothetical protein
LRSRRYVRGHCTTPVPTLKCPWASAVAAEVISGASAVSVEKSQRRLRQPGPLP